MRTISGTALAVLALAGAVPGAAAAQAPAAAAAAVDPAAERAARELLQLMSFDTMMQQGMAAPLEMMRSGKVLDQALGNNPQFAAARSRNPAGWEAAMKRLGVKQADATSEMLNSMKPEMMNLAIRNYAQNFTVRELQDLVAFYKTPLGQKTIRTMPVIMSQTMVWMQQQMPARMQEMQQRLGPDIQRELTPLVGNGQ